MKPVNTEVEELKAIVAKMTPGEWQPCTCSIEGPCPHDFGFCVHFCNGAVRAAAIMAETPNAEAIVALKNKALPLIEALLKRAEDAEAAVMEHYAQNIGQRKHCVYCLAVLEGPFQRDHKPGCIVAAIERARGKS